MGAQLRGPSETWGAAMSEQPYDFFGEIFQRYFRPAIDAYPRMGGLLVDRLLTLSDEVPDRLAQTRCAAMAWAKAETPNARITSELFVITQHGLMYAAGSNESRRALYYLATPPALFDPFIDQVDTAELREGTVVVVDSRFGRDLASAHPMDAALRRILDEHLALRVDLPAYLFLRRGLLGPASNPGRFKPTVSRKRRVSRVSKVGCKQRPAGL